MAKRKNLLRAGPSKLKGVPSRPRPSYKALTITETQPETQVVTLSVASSYSNGTARDEIDNGMCLAVVTESQRKRVAIVLVEEPDTSRSDAMIEVFHRLVAYGLEVKWMFEAGCRQILEEMDVLRGLIPAWTVFVMNSFSGQLYEALKERTDCRVYGPTVLLQCDAKKKVNLPQRKHPLLSLCMKNITVSSSNLTKEENSLIRTQVELLGGMFSRPFDSSITHLVTNSVTSPKALMARELRTPIVSPDWIKTCWEKASSEPFAAISLVPKYLCSLPKDENKFEDDVKSENMDLEDEDFSLDISIDAEEEYPSEDTALALAITGLTCSPLNYDFSQTEYDSTHSNPFRSDAQTTKSTSISMHFEPSSALTQKPIYWDYSAAAVVARCGPPFPPPKQWKFMMSGFTFEDKVKYENIIASLGGTVSQLTTFDETATHLVTKDIIRSEQFVGSVAAGLWVLHENYLLASHAMGAFADEDPFEWGGINKLNWGLSKERLFDALHATFFRKCRLLQKKKIFEGSTFVYATNCSQPQDKSDYYKRILRAGGGVVESLNCKDLPQITCLKNTKVIVDVPQERLSQAMTALAHLPQMGIKCYLIDFLDCYLFENPTDQCLNKFLLGVTSTDFAQPLQ